MNLKEIYKGQFLTVYEMEGLPFTCLKNVWDSNSRTMKAEDFKNEIEIWCQIVEMKKAYATLVDTLEFRFILNEKLKNWYNEEITPRKSKAGMRKISFLAPESAISKLSIKNLFYKQDEIEFKYFDKYDLAVSWLKEDF